MRRIKLGNVHTNPATFDGAVDTILQMTDGHRPYLVVTPNIAHVLQSRSEPNLRRAYRRADFAPPDGWPVVSAIRFLSSRASEVERVPGSDLMMELCRRPVSVALVGGVGESARQAATNLRSDNPELNIACAEPAPRAELEDPERRAGLISRIKEADPDIIFLGLGVPRQEGLALELTDALDRGVIMCVGASIEFAAGSLRRAPEFLKRNRLEWLFRLAVEPQKLFRRYLSSAPYFAAVVAREKIRLARWSGFVDEGDGGEEDMRFDRMIVHQFDPARPSPGGIDTCIRGLCRYAPAGNKLAIIGVDTSVDPKSDRCGKWERHNLGGDDFWFMPVVRLDPADQKRRIPHSLRLIAGLFRYRSRLKSSSVLQAHRMDTGLALRLAFRRPLVYFVHTQESGLTGTTSDSMWRFAGKLHSALERFVSRGAKDVLVFNEDYARTVSNWNSKARFSPTWFDPGVIEPEAGDRDLRRILWVGRVEEPKDPMLALRAFEELVQSESNEDWKLDVVGSGTLVDRVRNYASQSAVGDQISVHGRVSPEDVATMMARSGVFLMTSHEGYEGYPRVLVEALASGDVAVVTPGADTGGLVRDGQNGFTANGREPSELAKLIRAASETCSSTAARRSVQHLEAPTVVGRIFKSAS